MAALASLRAIPAGCGADGAAAVAPEARESCQAPGDEDSDGAPDCEDPDCWGLSGGCAEACDGDDDRDGDELRGCLDPDCWVSGGVCSEVCDGEMGDEDGDGEAGCGDADCWVPGGGCVEVCGSAGDEDGDSAVDCDDSDCWTSLGDCDERCEGESDEDGDALVDCQDDDCWLLEGACAEVCEGGHDEDADGLTDCDDEDCLRAESCIPTFAGDAQPIFLANCAQCHAEGQVFGFLDFSKYDDTQLPSYYCPGMRKGECTVVRINDLTMPQLCLGCVSLPDIEVLTAWIAGGMLP